MARIFEDQGLAKFEQGLFVQGKHDEHGQRIEIVIEIHGIGVAEGRTGFVKSGWMVGSDGRIRLVTPFTGFVREGTELK